MSKADDVGIWLPVYIGEMLAMTTRFSTEQIGALYLLMMDYWKNGAIPHDDKVVGAITGLSKAKAKTFVALILSIDIFTSCDGALCSDYLDDKKQLATHNKKVKSERAKKAADARWQNHDTSKQTSSTAQESKSVCTNNASAMLEICPSLSSITSLSHLDVRTDVLPIKDWTVPSLESINQMLKKASTSASVLSSSAYEQQVMKFKNYYIEQELLERPILTDERRRDVLVTWINNDRQY